MIINWLRVNFNIGIYDDYEHFLGMSAFKIKNSIPSFIQKGKAEYFDIYSKNKDVSLNTVYNIASVTKMFFRCCCTKTA